MFTTQDWNVEKLAKYLGKHLDCKTYNELFKQYTIVDVFHFSGEFQNYITRGNIDYASMQPIGESRYQGWYRQLFELDDYLSSQGLHNDGNYIARATYVLELAKE